MVKRGRDDDGAVAPAPAVEPARQRHYLAIRRALNDQFVADLTRKLTQNPTRRFDKEVADYEKFSRQLRNEYADVAAAIERDAAATFAAAGAIAKHGESFLWGTGDAGQLGFGEDVMELSRPKLLNTLPSATSVLKVVCGGMHTLWIVDGGLVYSAGVNDEGALGRKANKDDADAETKPGPVRLPGGAAAVDLSTGDSHVAVVTSDGAVVAWGTFRTSSGLWAFTPDQQIARSPITVYSPETRAGRIASVASGTDHVIARTAGGDVYSWGCGEKGRLGRLPPADADNTSKRDASAKTKLLTACKVPNLPEGGVTAIAAGSYHSLAFVAGAKEVYAWGLNSYGQLGLPYDMNEAGSNQVEYFPKRVAPLCGRGFVAGDGGENHTVLLDDGGKVYALGRSAYGRLGLPGIDEMSDEPRSSAEHVVGVSKKATKVVAGGSTSACVTDDGDAYVWGYGDLGQLGRGSDQSDALTPVRLAPTKAMGGKRVVDVSFGGQHTAALCLPPKGSEGTPIAKRTRGAGAA